MELCLVRHAVAADRADWVGRNDAERPLTDRGRQRMQTQARGLSTLFKPQLILTSPLLRARETAEILLDVYRLGRATTCSALATGDHAALLDLLGDSEAHTAMAVGHEPHLSQLIALLVAGHEQGCTVNVKKGAAALVSADDALEPGSCVLQWLVQPAALRAIANATAATRK